MKLTSALLRTSIFIDTSAFYALADRTDRLHSSAVRFVEANERLLVTSNFVVHETVTLIRMRPGHAAAAAFGRRLLHEDLAPVIQIPTRDELKAWLLFQRHSDKRFSFVDCTSFALMKRLGIPAAFAFDEDFRQFGQWIVYPEG